MANVKISGVAGGAKAVPESTDLAEIESSVGNSFYATLANISKGLVAGNIPNTPAGNIAATNIQAAIDELDSEKATSAQGTLADSATQPGDAATTLDGTAHRLLYIDASGNVTELAYGSSGEYLKSQGASTIPAWGAPEGTTILSTGEVGGTKFLREDGDNSSSWQTIGTEVSMIDAQVIVSNGITPTATTLTGDVTVNGTGVMAIAANAVVLADMEHGTQGDILYYGASGAPTRLGFGTSGQFLKTQGVGANPIWATASGAGDALVANGLDQFAATTSLGLLGVISDETGSGALVFATSPTLVTPALGTPASGVATNLTGTAAGLTAGGVTTNANLTGHVTSTGNAAILGSFTLAQLQTAISDNSVAIASQTFDVQFTLDITGGNGDYVIHDDAIFGYEIDSLQACELDIGTATITVKINTTAVTGISVAATTTKQTIADASSGASTVAATNEVSITVASVASSPTKLTGVLHCTRTLASAS